ARIQIAQPQQGFGVVGGDLEQADEERLGFGVLAFLIGKQGAVLHLQGLFRADLRQAAASAQQEREQQRGQAQAGLQSGCHSSLSPALRASESSVPGGSSRVARARAQAAQRRGLSPLTCSRRRKSASRNMRSSR